MSLGSVRDPFGPSHARAVGAAVEVTVRFHAVADDPDAAVLARWGEGVDRALEAVEGTRLATGHSHLERLGVPYTGNKHADAHGCCRKVDAQENP
jgi:hypothetical protein